MTRNSEDYWTQGYLSLPAFIPPAAARTFLGTLKADFVNGGVPFERLKRGSPLLRSEAVEIYGWHYPPMAAFLFGMTPAVSALTGRRLLPTYSYFRMYRQGDICRVHSDRYSCEHSISLLLASSDDLPWPLDIGTDPVETPAARADDDFGTSRFTSVAMQPGDAVLYQGVHRLHGRITPNPNRWSAHLFLHWVDAAGAYADHAFEGQTIPPSDRLELV